MGGFSAFWLLWLLRGFMWLLWLFVSHPLHSQFLSAWLLRLWLFASAALPVPFRQVALWLCRLWRLSGFGFSHPLLSQLVFGLGFLRPQHRQFLSGGGRGLQVWEV